MKILLPVDTDADRAIAAARAVTMIPHAAEAVEVTILNVQEELELSGGDAERLRSVEWYEEDDFPGSVDAATSVLEEAGIAVERRRAHAEPAAAILDVAEELGVDQIVIAGRKRTPVGKVLFGSVTQSVLLSADVPVTFVGE